jgi:hypothetical protein
MTTLLSLNPYTLTLPCSDGSSLDLPCTKYIFALRLESTNQGDKNNPHGKADDFHIQEGANQN